MNKDIIFQVKAMPVLHFMKQTMKQIAQLYTMNIQYILKIKMEI